MLRGKTIAITGAGGGIGRSLVLAFLKEQADVFASDLSLDHLVPLSAPAQDYGGRLFSYAADVTDEESLRSFRDHILRERGHIDYWINNAGITAIGSYMSSPADLNEKVIDINLGGVMRGTRLALEAMERRGTGTIVNIASVAGHLPAPYMTAYSTSKHGVVGFTRSLQGELEIKGASVQLMLVSPGFANTDIISRGGTHGFPEWLAFILATPDGVAKDIVRGIKRRKSEIYPTLNGKIMRRMYSLLPRYTVRSSKLLFTKSLKDAVMNRLNIPENTDRDL